MKCPHCLVTIHETWTESSIVRDRTDEIMYLWSMACPSCKKLIVKSAVGKFFNGDFITDEEHFVHPRFPNFAEAHDEVSEPLKKDYREACEVLAISPKASAAISRRILQAILTEQGYTDRDLAKQIDAVLNEQDARRALPNDLHTTVDAIRGFGNFSAHPITDQTTLQVIEVEDEEAEWCLQIVAGLFNHYYVRPAAARERKAGLNAKLQAAGKPPSK